MAGALRNIFRYEAGCDAPVREPELPPQFRRERLRKTIDLSEIARRGERGQEDNVSRSFDEAEELLLIFLCHEEIYLSSQGISPSWTLDKERLNIAAPHLKPLRDRQYQLTARSPRQGRSGSRHRRSRL